MSALKQAITDKDDIETDEVFVPQWDVTLQVRSMSGHDRARLVRGMKDDGASFETLYPDLIVLCTYDPDTGEQVFEDTVEDKQMLLGKNSAALEIIAKKAMEMSGMAEKSEEEVGKDS